MNKIQENKNHSTELNLTQIREWLWQNALQKTQQDWEQLKHILQLDYANLAEYEKARVVDNYQNFVIDYLVKWSWKRKELELKKNN